LERDPAGTGDRGDPPVVMLDGTYFNGWCAWTGEFATWEARWKTFLKGTKTR
jgi:hypothetical protein